MGHTKTPGPLGKALDQLREAGRRGGVRVEPALHNREIRAYRFGRRVDLTAREVPGLDGGRRWDLSTPKGRHYSADFGEERALVRDISALLDQRARTVTT
ncbi:hypothetical protein ACQEU5_25075 [Marinactinospora thermotolerans]|uniref:hypothetical protein n=1 Tax=Marinactinospora thermotolerans TaxID=531310 RepID=UPI003D913FBC